MGEKNKKKDEMSEKKTVKIPVAGIERNVVSSTSGAMDEVRGLSLNTDGRLIFGECYKENLLLTSLRLSDYGVLYAHPVKGNESILVAYSDRDDTVYMIAKQKDGQWEAVRKQPVCQNTKNVHKIISLGKILIVCGEKVSFAKYNQEKDVYEETSMLGQNDDNSQMLQPNIDFRFDTRRKHTLFPIEGSDIQEDTARIGFTKILKKEKQLGHIKGFVKVRYAFKLYDGSYILYSNPTLLLQPNDVGTRYRTDFKGNKLPYGVDYETNQRGFFDVTMADVGAGATYGDGKRLQYKYLHWYVNEEKDDIDDIYYYPDNGGWKNDKDFVSMGETLNYMTNGLRCPELYPNLICERAPNLKTSNLYAAVSVSHELMIFDRGKFDPSFKDIIVGVGVFMTDEVYGYHTNKPTVKQQASHKGFPCHCEYFQIKNDAILKKEIQDTDIFYKIADVSLDEISEKGYMVLDLKGKLDAIHTLERAKTEERVSVSGNIAELYNGRLHLGGCSTQLFGGYPLQYFQTNGITPAFHNFTISGIMDNIDKWQAMHNANKPFVTITVKIESPDGIKFVNKYIPVSYLLDKKRNEYSFPQFLMLSYPNANAVSMQIKVNRINDDGKYERAEQTFKLVADNISNMAYYIPNDVRIFSFSGNFSESSLNNLYGYSQKEENVVMSDNVMYVSEVNNPYLFLPKNKYTVGNGRIMDICAQTYEQDGRGSTGYAPLIVFSSDGIYSVSVDTSLNVSYSNSFFLSNKKIMSPNSAYRSSIGIIFAANNRCYCLANGIRSIDDKIQGNVLKLSELPYSSEIISSPKSANKKIEHNGTLSGAIFSSFLKYATFVENENRGELIVFRQSTNTYYVYRDGRWFSGDGRIRSSFSSLNSLYIVVDSSCYEFTNIPTTKATKGVFISKPIGNDNRYSRLTRAVVRGKFSTKDIVLVNNIDCTKIDMTTKAVHLFAEQKKYKKIEFTCDDREVEVIPLPESDFKNVEVDLTCIPQVRVSYIDNRNVYEGYLFFPEAQFEHFKEGIADYLLTLTSTTSDINAPNGGAIDTPIYLFRRAATSIGVAMRYKKKYWLMPDYTIVGTDGQPTSYASFKDWRLFYIPELASLPRYEIIDIKKQNVFNVDINTNYDLTYFGNKMQVKSVTLEAKTAYNITAYKPYVDYDKGFSIRNKEFNSYHWDDFLYKVSQNYFNASDVGYKDVNWNMFHNCPYRFEGRELDYPFFYDGEGGWVSYNELYADLEAGKYKRWKYAQFEPSEISLNKGDNVLLEGRYYYPFPPSPPRPYGDTPYFFTAQHTKTYNIGDIVLGDGSIEETVVSGENNVSKEIGQYAEQHHFFLLNREYYRIKTDGEIIVNSGDKKGSKVEKEYEFRYMGNRLVTTLADIFYGIGNSEFPKGIPPLNLEYTFYLYKGATRFRDLNGVEYLFDFPRDTYITYEELVNELPSLPPIESLKKYVCIYVYGSTDGHRWQLLGGNDRNGDFSDLGCLVERVDCKYFRILFCGELNNDSYIEYIELQGNGTIFNEKMR